MIARFYRFGLALQLLAGVALAWSLHTWWMQPPFELWLPLQLGLMLVLALVLLLAPLLCMTLLITVTSFALAAIFSAPRTTHLTVWQGTRLFTEEIIASLIAQLWTMPWCSFQVRLIPNTGASASAGASAGAGAGAVPVLLIHGYACNSGYWTSFSKLLVKAGICHRALDLEPPDASIDEYAVQVEQAVRQLCAETGAQQVIIVAHSMGGLAARAWLRAYGEAQFAGLISLGSPHHGSGLGRFGLGKNTAQMRWFGIRGVGQASPWLMALGEQESAAVRAKIVSIYSEHDNYVSPQSSSILEGASNIAFTGIAHLALASHPRIQARVLSEIQGISRSA